MSQIPEYQTPPTGDPRSLVTPPAIALMVVGGIGIALQAIGLLFNLLGIGMGAARGGNQALANMFSGAIGIVFAIIGIIVGIVILMGAMKMKNLQNYNFAMTAAIVAMIPCISPCCLLGLPFGIWALVILMKPEVKSAFTN